MSIRSCPRRAERFNGARPLRPGVDPKIQGERPARNTLQWGPASEARSGHASHAVPLGPR